MQGPVAGIPSLAETHRNRDSHRPTINRKAKSGALDDGRPFRTPLMQPGAESGRLNATSLRRGAGAPQMSLAATLAPCPLLRRRPHDPQGRKKRRLTRPRLDGLRFFSPVSFFPRPSRPRACCASPYCAGPILRGHRQMGYLPAFRRARRRRAAPRDRHSVSRQNKRRPAKGRGDHGLAVGLADNAAGDGRVGATRRRV